jgi:alginate O-acetyltransferase complex protein AlgI
VVFSSTVFLFLFLPLVLGLYFLARRELRNAVLVVFSVLFYAWGELRFVPIILASAGINYLLGILSGRSTSPKTSRLALGSAVIINIGLLAYYKYANFFVENANAVLSSLPGHHAALVHTPVALPLGISFLTFHALSYVIDIHRKQAVAQKSPLKLGLYLLFFPQLIAGPIVRYHDIADQLASRHVSMHDFAIGAQRFVLGLGKKVLVANCVAGVADGVFGLPVSQVTCGVAWLGAFAYALQIYFDFSGYSDMAIGLARLFGFRFLENFNYPYIARSVTEFWRRWHISLSNWFRDYLYVPLGGNRVGPARLYFNLVIVFFLCGLWHGASWTFVIWGLLHGFFLVLERVGLRRLLERAWVPLRHAYCLTVVVVTWVFFRADTFPQAKAMLAAMIGQGHSSGAVRTASSFVDNMQLAAAAVAVVGSMPLLRWLEGVRRARVSAAVTIAWELARVVGLSVVLLGCALRLSAGTYNPFIYFRF